MQGSRKRRIWPSANQKRKRMLKSTPSSTNNTGIANALQKFDLRYLEQWDLDSLMTDNVDITTSQTSFAVPLVDFAVSRNLHLGLSLLYGSGEAGNNGLIGNGWTLDIPQESIIVDHKESVFPSAFQYSYMIGSHMEPLTFEKEDEDGTKYFKLSDGESELSFIYKPGNQQWIVESNNIRSVFGTGEESGDGEAVQETLFYPNWRGPGTSESSLTPETHAWHLVSRQDRHENGRKLVYEYHVEQTHLPNGKSFTSVLLLKSVRDALNTAKLTLYLGVKNREEYGIQPYKNAQGAIQFPVFLQEKMYVTGYFLETPTERQQMEFDYILESSNKCRLLTGVRQKYADNLGEEQIFEFEYTDYSDTWLLSEYRRGPFNTMKFSYSTLQIPTMTFGSKTVLKYLVPDNFQVSIGETFSVLAYDISTGGIEVMVMSKQLTTIVKELTTKKVGEDNRKIEKFAVVLFKNLIVILEETENGKRLNIFTLNIETDEWTEQPERYDFGRDSLFRHSSKIMVMAPAGSSSIHIFEEKEEGGFTRTVVPPDGGAIERMNVQEDNILVYDGRVLRLIRKNGGGGWIGQTIDVVSSSELTFLNKFQFETDFANSFRDQLRMNGLQMAKNMILLSTVEMPNSNSFSTYANIYLLNERFELHKKNSFQIQPPLGFLDIRKNIETGGNTFYFRYENDINVNGKLKGVVYDAKGKIDEDIEDQCKGECSEDDKREMKEKMIENMNKDEYEDFKKLVLFDTGPFLTYELDTTGAKANSTKFIMTGDSWSSTDASKISNIPLGKNFLLKSEQKEDYSQFRLYLQNPETGGETGPVLETFDILSNGTFSVGFPSYISYQKGIDGFETEILPLKKDGIGNRFKLDYGENLLSMSNAEVILSFKNNSDPTMYPFTKELFVRRAVSFIPSEPMLVISKSDIASGDYVRSRSYENQFQFNEDKEQQENIVRVIPTGDRDVAGWYEEASIVPVDDPKNTQKFQRWFNSDGVEVKVKELDKQEEPEEEEDLSSYKIMDISGDLEICDISPYNKTEQMVAYFGFESYESNIIPGTNSSWIMDGTVISSGIPLTGENHLQLSGTQKITGQIAPMDQTGTYIASTWVRDLSSSYEFASPVEYFQVHLATHTGHQFLGLYGQMKRSFDNWIYVEVPINLDKIRSNVYAEYYHFANEIQHSYRNRLMEEPLPPPNNVNFTITFEVDASKSRGEFLDIDHIRFMPIQHNDMKVVVYNPKTAFPTEEILANGAVLKKVYNKYYSEVATFDEDGNLEQLKSGTRSGQIFPTPRVEGISNFDVDTAIRSDFIFKPAGGSYENWDLHTGNQNRWQVDNMSSFTFSKGSFLHSLSGASSNIICVGENMFDPSSSSIRFYYELHSTTSFITVKLNGAKILLTLETNEQGDRSKLLVPHSQVSGDIINLPLHGEIIAFLENSHVWIWIDGVLLVDRGVGLNSSSPWQQFTLEVSGDVRVSDFLILKSPQFLVEYYNAWGDQVQLVQLEDENSVLVSEILYDELGREAIKTKTAKLTRPPNSSEPLFIYHSDFVTNKDPNDPNSVFKTGIIEGRLALEFPEDEGYSYHRTQFLRDMLREPEIEGLPGKEFSITGPYTKQYSRQSDIPFLRNVFPSNRGFYEKIRKEPNGNIKVTILDKNENEIAEYTRVPGYDHILTTYEYNEDNKVIMMLPPNYHKRANTFARTTPWPVGKPDEFTEEERELQRNLGSHYNYTEEGFLSKKVTPDEGHREYVYDIMGNMRFMYDVDPISGNATNVVYMLSADKNRPVEVGYLKSEIGVADLKQMENSTYLPDQVVFQRVVYSDYHADPNVRGKTKLFLTYDDNTEDAFHTPNAPPYQELLKFDGENKVTLKTSDSAHADTFTYYNKYYEGGKMKELRYPKESLEEEENFNLIHSHDKSGRLTGLGVRAKRKNNPSEFSTFDYSSNGQVLREIVNPGILQEFVRNYDYNSPGLLTQIKDNFFGEISKFTEDGYGQDGFGDGIIMQNIFTANWTANLQNLDDGQKNWFKLPEERYEDDKVMKLCIQALKRLGFVDKDTGILINSVGEGDLANLPLPCLGSKSYELIMFVASYLLPASNYGYRYAYGNHQELVKAKYFNDAEQNVNPLQRGTFFDEVEGIESLEISERIWEILVENQYIFSDNRSDNKWTGIGKQGLHPLLNIEGLKMDLEEVDILLTPFAQAILELQFERVAKSLEKITTEEFQEAFVVMNGYRDTPTAQLVINRAKQQAAKAYIMLEEKGYLDGTFKSILDPGFMNLFADDEDIFPHIGKIAAILDSKFKTQIGRSSWDFESYSIDPNGNQLVFYTGLNRYELEYEENSNQVSKIIIKDPFALPGEDNGVEYDIEHDSRGNVVKSKNRNVERIKYHPVINRPTFMELSDGRRIIIKYDSQGERILKRVFDSNNKIQSQVKYLRDERGQVLMDKRTTYTYNSGKKREANEVVTTYIYGPRGLLGFMRNKLFYGVFTDHAGSVRLVVQNGKVVAGYDYWPYGELQRSFGDEEAHIFYRFTGQEYDEETGLYNYHARLYDPQIGRFLQPDPKSQYFSPYVYAGNSPISLVDPDGEFFFLLTLIICIAVGAYLGGAAANGSWNPLKWDWKSASTWLGILGGAAAGAALPSGFLTAVAAVGLPQTILIGLGVTYLSMVPGNGWNPIKWDWKSPALYNGFFQGFSSAMGMVPGIGKNLGRLKDLKGIIQSISKTGQKQLLEYSAGVGMAYLKGVMASGFNFNLLEWDWSDPSTYALLKDGFSMGKQLPSKVATKFRDYGKLAKTVDLKSMMKQFKPVAKQFFKDVLKDKHHPLYKIISSTVITYINMSLEAGTFDLTKWDWKSQSTFEGILNAVRNPIDVADMIHSAREGNFASAKKMLKPTARYLVKKYVDPVILQFYKDFKEMQGYLKSIRNSFKNVTDVEVEELNVVGVQLYQEFGMAMKELKDEGEFDHLIEGMFGSDDIYPVGGAKGFLDCAKTNSSTLAGEEMTKCDLSAGSRGKTARRNRELIHKLFVPTKNYISETFVQIPKFDETTNPTEFYEFISPQIISLKKTSEIFLRNFFIGAVFTSLTDQVFIRQEYHENLEVNVLHIAVISDSVLSVRSYIFDLGENLSPKFNQILTYLKEQQFACQFPIDDAIIDFVYGEILVVDNEGMHVATPAMSQNAPPLCSHQGTLSPQFIPAMNINATLYDHFESFLESKDGPSKVKHFEEFMQHLISIYTDMTKEDYFLNIGYSLDSFIGFTHGMFEMNFQQTYDLHMTLTPEKSLRFIATQNGNAFNKNWHATPAEITFGNGDQSKGFDFSSATFSKSYVRATISELPDTSELVSTVEEEAMPKFTGVGQSLLQGSGTEKEMEYLFHYHKSILPSGEIIESQENLHYISNFVLGEFLAKTQTLLSPHTEIYVYVPDDAEGKERLRAQRFFIVFDPENRNGTILNIIESSKISENNDLPIFDPSTPSNIPKVPDIDAVSYAHAQINLNINSKLGWTIEEAPSGSSLSPEYFVFQGINITPINPADIEKDIDAFVKLEKFSTTLSFHPSFFEEAFRKLSEHRLRTLISTDIDFQSVVYGFFLGIDLENGSDADGISLAIRKQIQDQITSPLVSPLLTLLTISETNDVVIPSSEQVLVMNLKLSNSSREEGMEEILETAKSDIDQYACTMKELFLDARTLSKVPAVYGPFSEKGVLFEATQVKISEGGNSSVCDGNPFKKYYTPPDPQVPPEDTILSCRSGAWFDDAYSMDAITCTTFASEVYVFPRIEANEVMKPKTPPKYFGDSYDKSSCGPIDFNGKPSVVCSGRKTTLVYRPLNTDRIFDYLDANIMLGRVMLHYGAKIWKVISNQKEETEVDLDNFAEIQEKTMSCWERSIADIEGLLNGIPTEGMTSSLEWARKAFTECLDDIDEELKTNSINQERADVISEKLHALHEDILEQMEVIKSTDNISNGDFVGKDNVGSAGQTGYFGLYSSSLVAGGHSRTTIEGNVSSYRGMQ